MTDRIDDYAMLAVQGPRARELVQAISDAPLPARMTAAPRRLAGAQVLVCGTGYTGEDGVELLASPREAPNLWDELLRRGAVPTGLAARDTLRLEACYHLYGNDLSTERGPIEAGLGWCCKEDTGFIGSEAVRAVREAGSRRKSSSRSRSRGPGSRARATRWSAGARSRAARSPRASASGSGWRTSPPPARRSARAWKSTFVARSARLS